MPNPIKMMLCIEAGKSKGKKITLKKSEYTIGSARKSSIRLRGEFVSPEHAILKLRDEGQWVLQNRSSNQTLVNDQIIDTKPLVVGDSIQVGASNLLKFDVVPSKSKNVAKSNNGQSEFSNLALMYLKKPVVIVALTFYIIVLFVVFSLLSGADESRNSDSWNRVEIDAVIERSSDYLLQRSNFVSEASVINGDDQADFSKLTSDQIHNAAKKLDGYDSIVWLHQIDAEGSSDVLVETVEDLMLQIQQKLMRTWHLEQQQRWSEVIDGYDDVSAMVPDIKLPITQKIIERRRWALTKQKDKR